MVEHRSFHSKGPGFKTAVVEHRSFHSKGPGFKTAVVEHRSFHSKGPGFKTAVVEHRSFHSKGPGFKTSSTVSKLRATSFTPLCLCLSEETVKAVGPFFLVSMPGEVKDPLTGKYLLW